MKLCIFDLDGTLTDTLSSIAFYGNSALEKSGFLPIPEAEYKYLAGNGRDTLVHRMLAYRNADTEENFKKVGSDYDEAYESDVICFAKPFPGIVKLIDDLKAAGVLVAVLSNKPDNVVVPCVEEIFGECFDYVMGAKKEIKIKPAPDAAFKIAETFGVKTKDCFFIGDTNIDICTGKAAGMKTIGVLWGFRDRDELLDAGADFIAEKAEEIYSFVTENL